MSINHRPGLTASEQRPWKNDWPFITLCTWSPTLDLCWRVEWRCVASRGLQLWVNTRLAAFMEGWLGDSQREAVVALPPIIQNALTGLRFACGSAHMFRTCVLHCMGLWHARASSKSSCLEAAWDLQEISRKRKMSNWTAITLNYS